VANESRLSASLSVLPELGAGIGLGLLVSALPVAFMLIFGKVILRVGE